MQLTEGGHKCTLNCGIAINFSNNCLSEKDLIYQLENYTNMYLHVYGWWNIESSFVCLWFLVAEMWLLKDRWIFKKKNHVSIDVSDYDKKLRVPGKRFKLCRIITV